MSKFSLIFLTWIAFLSLCTRAGAVEPFPAECKLTLAATIPITMAHGHIDVPVTVNGRARTFGIDTGAFTSTVNEQVVAEQGIKTHGIHRNVHIRDVGEEDAKLYATLDEFIIGNQKAQDARMEVMKTSEVDGLIGPDYLRNFDLDFDFAAGTLNLFRHHPCHGRAVYWTDDYFVVPMDVTDQGHIRIDVMLNGKPIRAMIDTGSPLTLIGQPVAQSGFGVDPAKSNVDGAAGVTLTGMSGGTLSAKPYRFDGLQIGGINIRNPVLGITTEGKGFHPDYSDLLLGMRELHNLHLYVAYQERKLYVSRANADASDPARTQH